MENYSVSINKIVTNTLYKTFGWVSCGLGLTAATSFLLSISQFMNYYLNTSIYGSLFRGVIIITQVILSLAIFFGFNRFSYSSLVSLFLAFSVTTGMMLSTIFIVFELSSIIGIFFITSGMYLGLAVYGLTTKRDLTPLHTFAVMFLCGLLLFGIINFFVGSYLFSRFMLLAGVFVFSIFTATDIQNLKRIIAEKSYDLDAQKKLSILGAVIMYQNFINLFIRLLILFGKKKKD